MQVDIIGRVNNLQLPITQPYIPLLECLVNSIESIEDAGIKDGLMSFSTGICGSRTCRIPTRPFMPPSNT